MLRLGSEVVRAGIGPGAPGLGDGSGEVLVCAVGFGGLRDGGGRVLGLSVGGGRGIGVRTGRGWREAEPFGGGETGTKVCGYVIGGLSGSGFEMVGSDMDGGEGGGDGVVDVERKVGPRGVDAADTSEAGESRRRSG